MARSGLICYSTYCEPGFYQRPCWLLPRLTQEQRTAQPLSCSMRRRISCIAWGNRLRVPPLSKKLQQRIPTTSFPVDSKRCCCLKRPSAQTQSMRERPTTSATFFMIADVMKRRLHNGSEQQRSIQIFRLPGETSDLDIT